MRFYDFRNAMRDFPVFSLQDARTLEPAFDRRRLYEWRQRGHIRKLARGHYVFADVELDENLLFRAAGKLYAPSYVSFESALAWYGIIPETVQVVTSASTRKTARFDTPIGRFHYHTVAPHLFFGYRPEPGPWAIAEIEKALIDYLYIHTDIASVDDFQSLRLNLDLLREALNRAHLHSMLDRVSQRRLQSRMNTFMDWLANA